ncbi:MAG: hypothetical protein H7A33_00725 [Deltaproteobacteria bacterium]|nr:hypothetical protein [Deltaproteobacteria bacterium]
MKTVLLKIRRQKANESFYWEQFQLQLPERATLETALQVIQERPINLNGESVAPVVWEAQSSFEQSKTMVIVNGAALSIRDVVLDELVQPIVVEPLAGFSVIRDLWVDLRQSEDETKALAEWIVPIGFHEHSLTEQNYKQAKAFAGVPKNQQALDCVRCGACAQNKAASLSLESLLQLDFLCEQNNQPLSAEQTSALIRTTAVFDYDQVQAAEAQCPLSLALWDSVSNHKKRVRRAAFKNLF